MNRISQGNSFITQLNGLVKIKYWYRYLRKITSFIDKKSFGK